MASGAYDVAMALGVEKVKDGGYQGLNASPPPNDGTARTLTAAAMFSMVAPAYANKYGVDPDELQQVLARIAWKNHYNGARNPRAQFRREVSIETICASPRLAGNLGVFDCAGVADGAAAAIVVRAEDAHKYTDKPLYVKALSLVAGTGAGSTDPTYDYTTFPEIVAAATDAYQQAGITDPRAELAMAEVHDCFTPTELVLMEDLGFAERGTAWKECLAGTFDLERRAAGEPRRRPEELRPPGRRASGLRMMFEAWLQLRGEAPERAAHREPRAGRPHAPRPDPEPRRLPRRDGRLHQHPRHRSRTDASATTGHRPETRSGSGSWEPDPSVVSRVLRCCRIRPGDPSRARRSRAARCPRSRSSRPAPGRGGCAP